MWNPWSTSESSEEGTEDENEPGRLRSAMSSFRKKVKSVWPGTGIDAETIDELEAALLQSDVSLSTTEGLLEPLREDPDLEDSLDQLRRDIRERFERAGSLELNQPEEPPAVYFFLGVNGSGKTTSLAKLAHRLGPERDLLFAAGDTYRAAAVEQLHRWGERLGIEVISHERGGDPAAVVYDAMEAAEARAVDGVLVDTAGRLHTRDDLMEQLRKMIDVAGNLQPGAPHENLLVMDATTGQNGLQQAWRFARELPLTGMVLTKMDSTARGGVVLSIADELELPVKLVGTGEELDDLVPFNVEVYIDSLLGVQGTAVSAE